MENNISAQENLDYIKRVMLDSKNLIKDNGIMAIIWGTIIIGAQLSTFFMIRLESYSNISMVWIAAISIGWILTFISAKKSSKTGVVTASLKIDSATWISAGISMTVFGFAGSYSGLIHWLAINPTISLFLGSAYYITGVVYSDRLFKLTSFGWWAGAAALFFVRNEYSFIIFSAMMLMFQTIPGIMLYIKYKKEEAK
jgi:hypothetical protein